MPVNRELDGRNAAPSAAFVVEVVSGAAMTITGPNFVESSAEDVEASAEDHRESDPS